MFKSARIKLTGFYLLIIMIISLSFSGIIYRQVSYEYNGRLISMYHKLTHNGPVPEISPMEQIIAEEFAKDVLEAKSELLNFLVLVNGAIFIFSGVAGYFLAGKTLHPIEQALEQQKRFIADASHELKTPLTSLITTLEVTLEDKNLTLPESKQAMKEAIEEAFQIKNMTNDLLLLAKSEQNHVSKENLSVKEILTTVEHKFKKICLSKKITLNVSAATGTIYGNKENIEQLFSILVDNAIKYSSPKAKIQVKTKKEKNAYKIVVSDNGVGISKADLPHIFDRFYRADNSRSKQQVEGTGLGLSIAKKIVDIHNGSISAVSKLGKGTDIIVTLPKLS